MGNLQNLLLISEDDQFHQTLVGMLHQDEGNHYNISRVTSLAQAIQILDTDNFALIVVDLPQEAAYSEIADQVRDTFGKLPVVLLSSSGHEQAINAIRKGIQQVINKSHIDNEMMLVTITSSIERQKMENELRMRDEILKTVNEAAELFLKQPDWDAHLDNILMRLGEATESDYIYLYQNHYGLKDKPIARIFYEWCDTGLLQTGHHQSVLEIDFTSSNFFGLGQKLQNGEHILSNSNHLLVTTQSDDFHTINQSLLVVPIFSSSGWWGIIAFEHYQKIKNWSPAEMDAVKTSASMIGAAISRQIIEEELKYLATHDSLTGLPNRLLFADRFQQAVSRAQRSGEKVAVICLDLNKFKSVNDTFGHPAGDKALIEVANRLSSSLRGSDTCARIGGDEFGFIADNIKTTNDVIKVMEKLSQSLFKELDSISGKIIITASMGASLFPDHGTDLETLLMAADKALYQVKNSNLVFKVFQKDEQYSWLKD